MQCVFLKIHPKDNVLAALQDIKKGFTVDFGGGSFETFNNIQVKHKFATRNFEEGDEIIMYGTLIGRATKPITKGESITIENVVHATSEYSVGNSKLTWQAPDVSKWKNRTFDGYHRADGSVGTANHWLVIPLVFCENRNIEVMKSALMKALGYQTTTDFIVDTESLIEQYKKGASADELLNSHIIRTSEEIKQNL